MADTIPAGSFIGDLVQNQLKSYLLSQLDAIWAAVKAGDLSKIDGVLSVVIDQVKAKTGVAVTKDDLAVAVELANAVLSKSPKAILNAVGDGCKQTATHFGDKPLLLASAGDPDAPLLAAIDLTKATAGDGEKAGGIVEVVAVVQLVIQLVRWWRERRNAA